MLQVVKGWVMPVQERKITIFFGYGFLLALLVVLLRESPWLEKVILPENPNCIPMKTLFALFLVPLSVVLWKGEAPEKAPEEISYVLKVYANSTSQTPPTFNLTITGVSLAENRDTVAYSLAEKNLKPGYTVKLREGKYKLQIESKAKKGEIVAKVDCFRGLRHSGSGTSDSSSPTFELFNGNLALWD